MPNWVDNRLIVTAAKEDQRPALDAFFKVSLCRNDADEDALTFGGILPVPSEFKDCYSWPRIEDQEGVGEDFNMTAEEDALLRQKHGVNCGYDWCCKYWGTKWDACDSSMTRKDPDTVVAVFNTAWSEPKPFFKEASLLYPTLVFRAMWYGEENDDGELEYRKGELVYEGHGQFLSNDLDPDQVNDLREERLIARKVNSQ